MTGTRSLQKTLPAVFLAAAVFLLLPRLLSAYVVSLLVTIGIYSIAAVALNLLLGNTGQISLGQAAFFGIGAYTSALATVRLSLSFWLALPLGGLTACFFGYMVGLTSVRLRHAYLAMATIAFNEIFVVVTEQWEGLTGGLGGVTGIKRPTLLAHPLGDVEFLYLVWVLLFLILLFNRNLLSSRIGNTLAAIRQDEAASSALGINVTVYKLKLFTLSAFYTGVAGALFAHYARFIGPGSFQIHFSILLLMMVELGGPRHALGGVVGAAVIVLLPELLSFVNGVALLPHSVRQVFGEYSYHLIIYGVLLFVMAAFAPGGLVGWMSRLPRSVLAPGRRIEGGGLLAGGRPKKGRPHNA